MSYRNIQLPKWAEPFAFPARYKSMRGGRGSGKSTAASILMIMRMAGLLSNAYNGYPDRPVRIASCRDFDTNLSSSVKVLVEKYIKIYGFDEEFDIQDKKIKHKNGSVMDFHGVTRNPDKFLSMEDVDIFWMEQAEVLGDEMIKIAPTIRKPGSELWFVWNPTNRTNYCWKRFVLQPREGDLSILANFMDNPWFTDELEAERSADEENEPALYPWIWLGQPLDGDAESQILPYDMVAQCVKAWPQRPGASESGVIDAGFDIAEGGRDKCCVVVRKGPCITDVKIWPGIAGDLDPAAAIANKMAQEHRVIRMYYDAALPMIGPLRRQIPPPNYGIKPVHFGGEVQGKTIFYQKDSTNEDMFSRFNIQMATNLRLRATRTIQLLKGKTHVNPVQCLFINPELPNLELFMAELTQPLRRLSPTTHKWEIDKRGGDEGAKSPDRFDATCLAFARDCQNGLKARN